MVMKINKRMAVMMGKIEEGLYEDAEVGCGGTSVLFSVSVMSRSAAVIVVPMAV